MKKVLSVLFPLLILFPSLQCQEYKEVLKDIFYEAEFWLVEESYSDALIEYQKLYTRGYADNANINYRIGICYLNIPGEKDKSIPYLEKAVKSVDKRYKEGIFSETHAPYDAWLYLGNAYRISQDLEKAFEAYNKYKELAEDKDIESIKYTDKQIESCRNAREAFNNPVFYIQENTGELINTSSADYNPVVSFDEETMVYMTSLKFYDAIKLSKKVDGKWTEPVQITSQLEPDGKLLVNSISRDGKELFLNQEDNFNSDIYVSVQEEDRWGKAKPLNNLVNTKYWESHASISGDGNHLYIASNRKSGKGGTDIWVSLRGPEGWQEPLNLGEGINTELNEDHPFISEDGNVLYFASQGHNTIGGYDIYYSEKLDDGSWAEPKNLGYPLNTTDDDLFFVPIGNGKYGYQALFEEDNLGSRDIYRYQIFMSEAEYKAALALLTPGLAPIQPTLQPTEPEKTPEEPAEPIVVPPVQEEARLMYVIRPVFFEFDKYDLTSGARSTLDDLAVILEVYPMLEVEAEGHTDHMGSDNYNLMLSKKRSASVVSYLTQKGIDGKRIKSVGKGEGNPIAINMHADGSDSPEGRKLNRRVEIRVITPELPNVKVEEIKVPSQLKK